MDSRKRSKAGSFYSTRKINRNKYICYRHQGWGWTCKLWVFCKICQRYRRMDEKVWCGQVIAKLHENNIHVIGRIVCFNDRCSRRNTGICHQNQKRAAWLSKTQTVNLFHGQSIWDRAWDYLIDIAKEGIEKGFDEIQFDYVRFPSGKNISMYFGANPPAKYQAIDEFLGRARKAMLTQYYPQMFWHNMRKSADSENIGQNLEMIGKDLDYISPWCILLICSGQIVNGVTFSIPDFKPYDVVYNSLIKAKNRISKITDGIKPRFVRTCRILPLHTC